MLRFKVGDKVTIRQWEDMVKEYGIDKGGCIPVPKLFTHTMKMYCGNTYTIKSVYKDYYVLDGIGYDFSDEMFEESKAPKYSYKPKYWIVKRDKSNPLFQKCLNYLNETYGTAWTGNGESYDYYGFDGRSQYDNLESFENNPKLITLEEWDKWFGSEVSSDVKPEFKVGDRVYVKDTSVWCPGKFGVIVSISGITMSHCVKLDSGYEFYLDQEDLVKCEVATDVTGICSDIGTTLTQEKLQNVIDKLSGKSAPIQITDTSYTEIYDSYKKLRGSGPTEAEEEPTSIFTFKKLK